MDIEFYKEQGNVKCDLKRAIITIINDGNCVSIDGMLNSYELEKILSKMKELHGESKSWKE